MKIVVGFGVLILLLIGLILALPFVIDLNKYQDHYRPLIEDALNRKVTLQDIRLTIWPRIGARIGGFTVQDDPAFRSGPFASLSSLDVGVKLMPLLSKKVEIEEITLRNPVINLLKTKSGALNVSTIGRPPSAPPSPGTAPTQPASDPMAMLALLAVDRLSIDGGKLIYRDESTPQPTEYQIHDLELLLKSVHLGHTPTLHFGATVQPYNLPVTLNGSFGPLADTLEIKQYDFMLGIGKIALALKGALIGGKLDAILSSSSINSADLPVSLPLTKPVQVNDLRVVAKAPYPLRQGVSAIEQADVTDLSLTLVMGHSSLNVKGTVLGGHAKMTLTSPSVNTADLPVDTGLKQPADVKNLEANADLKGQEARLTNLSFQLFNGQATAQGGLSLGSGTPPFHGRVTIQGVQLGPALEAVRSDSTVSVSGTAAMDIAVAGRGFSLPDLTKALEGPGHVEVKEGKIEGVNLMQEVATLLKMAGVSVDPAKTTAFSLMETDFVIKQGIVNVQKLFMDSHDFQATGSGTVGFDQVLNLALNLNLSQTLSQKLAGSSPIAKLVLKDGRLRLPLLITGTVQAPSYGLDAKGLTGKVQEQVQEKVKEAVGGLLEGTTKPNDLKQQGKDLLKDLFGK